MTSEAPDVCDLLCLDLPRAEAIRTSLPSEELRQRAAEQARGLAEPTRIALATALASGGELCVCDLSWITGTSKALASHHLRQLRAAGMVTSRRDGKLVLYRLAPQAAALLGILLGTTSASTP
ncbi:helix-turn-helix transcriptional regulator [Hoyosella sp. G463]|uniref:Helix-turn-helix transcriptional regulator n=1 Tax=Lolliginicoccus lacisalsi TaxID=2742202 RepID=A0A927JA68_9ACTN|nr:metalloregulator ArsR/SmtB family transcription factor [Lolliginicoccus lacisalsi]MBD8504947.1 helix-turn-helix transcriptional regulator [Lolliginicoccus lacisalsi]